MYSVHKHLTKKGEHLGVQSDIGNRYGNTSAMVLVAILLELKAS